MIEKFKVENIQQAFIDGSAGGVEGVREHSCGCLHEGGRWAGLTVLGEAQEPGKKGLGPGSKGQGWSLYSDINSLCGLRSSSPPWSSVSTTVNFRGWAWGLLKALPLVADALP